MGRIHLLGAFWEPIPAKHRNPPFLTQPAVDSLLFGGFSRQSPRSVPLGQEGGRLQGELLMAETPLFLQEQNPS